MDQQMPEFVQKTVQFVSLDFNGRAAVFKFVFKKLSECMHLTLWNCFM